MERQESGKVEAKEHVKQLHLVCNARSISFSLFSHCDVSALSIPLTLQVIRVITK
jgi:hypothetical protein